MKETGRRLTNMSKKNKAHRDFTIIDEAIITKMAKLLDENGNTPESCLLAIQSDANHERLRFLESVRNNAHALAESLLTLVKRIDEQGLATRLNELGEVQGHAVAVDVACAGYQTAQAGYQRASQRTGVK